MDLINCIKGREKIQQKRALCDTLPPKGKGECRTNQRGFCSQKHPKVPVGQQLGISSMRTHLPQSSTGSLTPWQGTIRPGQT
jgi:hypothetical protein